MDDQKVGAVGVGDERARAILLRAYWSAAGWRQSPLIAPDDFAYAAQAGYLFRPTRLLHDEVIERARAAVGRVAREAVAAGFLTSLGSRRLEWRSALGSYSTARHLSAHPLVATASGQCAICGLLPADEYDWSVLNFERHKWGGVRHHNPAYIAFDLEQFAQLDAAAPTLTEGAIMRAIVDTIRALAPMARPRDLERELRPIVTSNRPERDMLITILGYCGILHPAGKPGFFRQFPPWQERDYPPGPPSDWAYPVRWWRGGDGLDLSALAYYFPDMVR